MAVIATKYETYWSDQNDWEWKLVIKPSSSTLVDYWNAERFPAAGIESLRRKYEYDTQRHKAPTVNDITLTFNISTLQNGLIDCILYPTSTWQASYSTSQFPTYNDTPATQFKFQAGTVYELYTNYGGKSGYRLNFWGVQNIGVENGLSDGLLEVTVQDIYKTVYQSIPISSMNFVHQNTAQVTTARFYNDFASKYTTNWIGLFNQSFNDYFNFMPYIYFSLHIHELFKIHFRWMIRDDSYNINSSLPYNDLTKYYKQSYDATYSLGTEITDRNYDMYVLVSKANKDIADINDTDYEIIESIDQVYSDKAESLWDWVQLFWEGELMCAFPEYENDKMGAKQILGTFNHTLSLKHAYDVEVTFLNVAFQNVTTANIEAKGNDITDYTESLQGTENSEEADFTVVFGTHVLQSTTAGTNWKGRMNINTKKIVYWRNDEEVHHYSKFFYIEKPTYETDTYVPNDIFNCVHGYVDHCYGTKSNGTKVFTSDYYTQPALDFSTYQFIWGNKMSKPAKTGESVAKYIQMNTGSALSLSKSMLSALNPDNAIELKYTKNILDEYSLPYSPHLYHFDIDLEDIKDIPSGILSKVTGKFVITAFEHTIIGESFKEGGEITYTMRNTI